MYREVSGFFFLWISSKNYAIRQFYAKRCRILCRAKRALFAFAQRSGAMKAPVGLLSDRTVLRKQDGGALPRQVRVCAAQRSNESPSGAFKRPNGLAQQDGGASPRQVRVCAKLERVADECRPVKGCIRKRIHSAFPSSLLLYPSPHAHMASRTGFRLYPSSVSVYSTRGGTSA